jgi:predicted RNase H-like nuclease (RuvC/YqgF family)
MKVTRQDIFFGLLILLLLWNLFSTNNIKTDIKSYKNNIEQLQIKVDSANIVDKKITSKIDSVQQKVTVISKEIQIIDKNIDIIRKKTNEKVNYIDMFDANELEQFFTNRYNEGSN